MRVATTHAGYRGSGLPKPSWKVSCWRLHGTGVDCSVVNDPLGEPGCTPLYVSLPSTWGSVDGDQMFPLFFMGRLLTGDWERYKWRNHWLWRWSFSLHRDPVGEHGGGAHLPGTLRERCRRKLLRWVSVYVGAHYGTWRDWLGILRDSWTAPESEHLSLQELCCGGSFLGTWKDMGRRAQGTDIILHGASGNGASLSMGALLGEYGRGGLLC